MTALVIALIVADVAWVASPGHGIVNHRVSGEGTFIRYQSFLCEPGSDHKCSYRSDGGIIFIKEDPTATDGERPSLEERSQELHRILDFLINIAHSVSIRRLGAVGK